MQGQEVELKVGESVRLSNQSVIKLVNVVYEEIAPSPFDGDAYPEGNGVTVHCLVVRNSIASNVTEPEGEKNLAKNTNKINSYDLFLSELSPPYEDEKAMELEGYRYTLLRVEGHQNPIAVLNITPL